MTSVVDSISTTTISPFMYVFPYSYFWTFGEYFNPPPVILAYKLPDPPRKPKPPLLSQSTPSIPFNNVFTYVLEGLSYLYAVCIGFVRSMYILDVSGVYFPLDECVSFL